MPGSRRLAELVAGCALLSGVGFSIAEDSARKLAWLGVAASLAASAGAAAVGWDRDQQVPWEVDTLAEAANKTPGVDDVALVDIGRFGWFFEGRVFDLVGLTDRHIARREGGHGDKAWDEAYFRARLPAIVLVRSEDPITDPLRARPEVGTTEGGVLKSMLTAGGYRYHASVELGREEFHWLLVFRRADVELPEELWGPAPARDLRELLDGLLLRQQLPTPSG